MSRITAFVPVFEPTSLRKRNLEFLCCRLRENGIKTIVAVQRVGRCDEAYYRDLPVSDVMFLERFSGFNKSFVLNQCLDVEIETPFVLLLDSDLYFDFDSLRGLVLDDEVVKPFSECHYLTEELTEEFLSRRSITIPEGLPRVSALGGGAVVLRRDLVVANGLKFDESFEGWGWEDIDFGDLIRSKGLRVRSIPQPAVHLYHEPAVRPDSSNFLLYSSKGRPRNKIVHVFFVKYQSRESIDSFLSCKNSGVVLMGFGEVDTLNDPNVKFMTVQNESQATPGVIMEMAVPFAEEGGWVLFTRSSFVAAEGFYESLAGRSGNYATFGKAEGFAVRLSGSRAHR